MLSDSQGSYPTAKCAQCGDITDNYCIIERGPREKNWIEDVWVKLGFEGHPVCAECYYK